MPRKATKIRNDAKAPTQAKVKYSKRNIVGGKIRPQKKKAKYHPLEKIAARANITPQKKKGKHQRAVNSATRVKTLSNTAKRQSIEKEKNSKTGQICAKHRNTAAEKWCVAKPKNGSINSWKYCTTKKMRRGRVTKQIQQKTFEEVQEFTK